MIDQFRGKYRFLSNFWPCEILHRGITYSSVEHAYQAMKTLDIEQRHIISQLTAGEAKRYGQKLHLRDDWEQVKLGIMFYLVKLKFTNSIYLQDRLIATFPEELIEGNNWKDTYWGVCGGVGKNWLGIILMIVRSQLNASYTERTKK